MKKSELDKIQQKHALGNSFDGLLKLARILRSDTGCPWDREQTLDTIAVCLNDEKQELLTAITNHDSANVREELGDVLFNLALMMAILIEQNPTAGEEVFRANLHKIISRHTWVFGQDKAHTPEEALQIWKTNKQKEKQTIS